MRNQNQGGDVLFHDAGWFLSNFTRAIIRLTGARRKLYVYPSSQVPGVIGGLKDWVWWIDAS